MEAEADRSCFFSDSKEELEVFNFREEFDVSNSKEELEEANRRCFLCDSKEELELCDSCNLGKPVPTIIDEFLEKFQRGEGGSFPIQKISLQNF